MYYWSSNRISVLVYLFNGALICIYVSESARALLFPFEIVSKFVVRLLMFIEAQAITHTHTKCIAAHIISFSFVIAMDRRWRSRKISKFHVIRETHTHTHWTNFQWKCRQANDTNMRTHNQIEFSMKHLRTRLFRCCCFGLRKQVQWCTNLIINNRCLQKQMWIKLLLVNESAHAQPPHTHTTHMERDREKEQ